MSRGHNRERQVRDRLADEDWVVVRAAGSLGGIDLVALRAKVYELEPGVRAYNHAGIEARLIEVKSTAQGPYEHFGPADRHWLSRTAQLAGAEAWLAWWPKNGKLRWIPEVEWPHG